MLEPLEAHYSAVIRAFCDGRAIPFFGAGVNVCDRPPGKSWRDGHYLPSGGELSEYLADHFSYQPTTSDDHCPECNTEIRIVSDRERRDLTRVSQFVALAAGLGPLYDELRNVFIPAPDFKYPPTSLHRFFAALPAALRARGYPRTLDSLRRRLVMVTTNYDDVLESAFRDAGEPFHTISYMADTPNPDERGKCIHRAPDNRAQLIQSPNDYTGLTGDFHPVIVKIHGAVDRENADHDSFVITEDHYIDYLTRSDIENLLPNPLPAILKRSNFLFLGYSLRDMNLRVILHLINRVQRLNYKSWAIQLRPRELDQKFWRERGVDILDSPLEKYIAGLTAQLQAVPLVPPAAAPPAESVAPAPGGNS